MFSNIFKYIFNINILYANPLSTDRLLKKKGNVILRLIRSNLITVLIQILVYSFLFYGVNLKVNKLIFDRILIFFIILNILQSFTFFYNVFYESEDIKYYLSLPIKENEVFFAKLAVIFFTSMPLSVPFIPLFAIFSYLNGINIFFSIFIGIFNLLAYSVLIITIDFIIFYIIKKFVILKKGFLNILTFLAIFINVGMIIYLNRNSVNESISENIGILSKIYLNSFKGLLLSFLILAISGIIFYLGNRSIKKNYFKEYRLLNNENIKKEKTLHFSKFSYLLNYNISLLKYDDILFQAVIMPALFPVIMIVSVMAQGKLDILRNLIIGNELFFVCIFNLTIIGNYNLSGNLSSIYFSIEKDNFYFIKSLPIDLKRHFKIKLYISTIILSISPIIFNIIIFNIINIGKIYMLISIIFTIIFTYSISLNWLIYDYNNIYMYNNITELLNRSSKSFKILNVLIYAFTLIISVILYIFLKNIINIIFILSLIIFFLISINKFRKQKM